MMMPRRLVVNFDASFCDASRLLLSYSVFDSRSCGAKRAFSFWGVGEISKFPFFFFPNNDNKKKK